MTSLRIKGGIDEYEVGIKKNGYGFYSDGVWRNEYHLTGDGKQYCIETTSSLYTDDDFSWPSFSAWIGAEPSKNTKSILCISPVGEEDFEGTYNFNGKLSSHVNLDSSHISGMFGIIAFHQQVLDMGTAGEEGDGWKTVDKFVQNWMKFANDRYFDKLSKERNAPTIPIPNVGDEVS